MAKHLTEILGENYLQDGLQKTKIGKSFVELHRANLVADRNGNGDDVFNATNVKEAPYKKAQQDGFPAPGQEDDYNLPSYYDSKDKAEGDTDDGEIDYNFQEAGDDDNYSFDADDIGDDDDDTKKKKNEETKPRMSLQQHLAEGQTRKDFQNMANTIRSIEDPKKRQEHADLNASVYAKGNPRFDHAKFHAACGTSYKKDND